MPRNVLIVAGEASGDLYGAELARELKRIEPDIVLWGTGGEKMEREGVELLYTTREFAVLGFAEVFARLPFFFRAMKHMKQLVRERRPSVFVPIDYPGFNMRLARFVSDEHHPVAYFVSPQIWAWGWGRVPKIRSIVSRMIVTFPFEEDIYRKENIPVTYAGHPLIDLAKPELPAAAFRAKLGIEDDLPIIALFPGSRTHEVDSLLPVMMEAVSVMRAKGERFHAVLGAAPTVDDAAYDAILGDDGSSPILRVRDATYDLLAAARFAILASGTMTVEAAVLRTPMIIIYKVKLLSYLLGRLLVRVNHIGMVNILAEKRVVPELLQGEANAENVVKIAGRWLRHDDTLSEIHTELDRVRLLLGGGGASRRAAEAVIAVADTPRETDGTS